MTAPRVGRGPPRLASEEARPEPGDLDSPRAIVVPSGTEPARRSIVPAAPPPPEIAAGATADSPPRPPLAPVGKPAREPDRPEAVVPAMLRPPAAARSQDRPIEAAGEQRVTVRIGAIEIRTAEPTRPRADLPTQPLLAPPTPAPLGFDAYARLRSYAPWISGDRP
jgi:hypothetical protein